MPPDCTPRGWTEACRTPPATRTVRPVDGSVRPVHAIGRLCEDSVVGRWATKGVVMAVISRAEATWSGSLVDGSGEVSSRSSHAFTSLPISWAARTEDHGGLTSPEELVAAAHASCFAMAFSGRLTRAGAPPERLDVSADVTFEKLEAGWRVVSSALTVRGVVPGMSAAVFAGEAEAAKDTCPISQALKGNVALSVEATLES